MNGVEVSVYERDVSRTTRVQGATLNINRESGLKALQKAGLMEPFKAAFRPGAEKLLIVDRDGKVLVADGGHGLQEERPEIDRGPLRELLLNSLAPGTVVWNSHFSSLERVEGKVRLNFANGETADADLVVGADGANSKIRPYVTSVNPLYTGVVAIEGLVDDVRTRIPGIHARLDEGKICVLGDEKTLFIVAKGDGSVVFYAGFNAGHDWSRTAGIDFSNQAEVTNWFRKEFSGWELWSGLFETATPPFFPRPQYYAPPDQTWEALPDVTLIGDAAHVMPPFAGEGVNMAMLDALELAECLLDSRFADRLAAIASYEEAMRARSSLAIRQSLEFTSIFHSTNAIPYFTDFFGRLENQ